MELRRGQSLSSVYLRRDIGGSVSRLTDVIYLIYNVDMYDARRGERLGENGCELSE